MLSLAIFAASLFIFFHGLDRFPLKNWDEAWYAEITKNMVSGDYSLLVPFWNGQYYFDKPPLYFWLSYPFFALFGPGEWQARVVGITAAVACVLLIFLIARKLFNPRVAIFSVLVFLTTGHVVGRFGEGDLDALMIFLFMLSFWLYLLAKEKRTFWLLTGISIGLGVLVKGWLLGLSPLAAIVSYSLFVERKVRCQLFTITIPFFLATSIWWFVAGTWEFGKPFLDWYVLAPASGNLSTPLVNFSSAYFKFFLIDFGFWLLVIVAFLFFAARQKSFAGGRVLALVLPTFLFIFGLNFLNEKMDWYLLPAYPFLAIVAGYMLERMWKIKARLALFVLTVALIAQLQVVYWIEVRYPDRSHIGAALGKQARELVQPNEVVVLDDHDFTAFLFYSNLGTVYEVSEKGGKDWEWWTLRYNNLPKFVRVHPNTWIISRDLPGNVIYGNIVESDHGYKFGKVKTAVVE